MPYKYDEHDATDLSKIIRRRRPEWTHKGIMTTLQQLAATGATLGQATTAAEKAALNKNATTPAAILWPEHLTPDTKTVSIHGTRVCGECTHKKPAHEMTRTTGDDGHWICADCAGASDSDGARV
jgi:hypothetical protein